MHDSSIKTAMVMAAGHGTRLRPLTYDRSKAMVTLGGQPLIDHMLDRLTDAGIERVIVNVHAHADHLETHLRARATKCATGPEIIISDERTALLETGGGVVKALPLLGDNPIFICNIDAVWIEFAPVIDQLLLAWDPDIMDELLLCARQDWSLGYDGKGDFNLGFDNQITRRSTAHAEHVYAGVQIFKPALAKAYKAEPFSRNRIWDDSLKRGRIYGAVLPGFWMHIGDPKARIAAEAVLRQARID